MIVAAGARPSSFAGTGALLAFALRRERFALPLWLLGLGALMAMQSVGSQRFYGTPEELAQLRATLGASAAALATGGPARLLHSVGGEVLFEVFAYLAIVAALMNMFLIGRHTRSDEETGRAELVRSARVGRRAPMVAALAAAATADVAAGLVVFAAAAASGLPIHGSILAGVAVGGIGFTFAAATCVAAQIFENPRSVYGSITTAIAGAYVLRAVGDAGDSAVAWASPIGWGQRTYPYVDDRWWPVLLFVVASAALVGIASFLLERRDFGAGLLGYGTGRAGASVLLGSPLGLAWRLQRAVLAAWCGGVFALGVAYGSFADSIEQYLADNPAIAAYLPGGVEDAVDSYLTLTISITSLLAAAYGVAAVLRARTEEVAGRADTVLSAPIGRGRWLASHLAVVLPGTALVTLAGGFGAGVSYGITTGDPAQPGRLAVTALVYLPAVWVIVAVAVAGFGWIPKGAAVLAWAVFAYCVVVLLFSAAFDLPGWFGDGSPFRHTPQAPLEETAMGSSAALLSVAVLLLAAGFAGFRRRDVTV
ncbi:ABC transporter permease [Nocardia cyriacigeorgica]|uniref:ABC transporter permease n=1 Tax=Nocardia cyriacigeorgica TaxID=135487 RepID=UPI001892ED4E|nr:ABC transporter permease [Nocardia cyriacigeorgica]MBF6161701.1 ABC transporter permease [Nocardia cyriacigeorgica]MBF6200499.1 ABC transporter permease [Nocardia cyriacigeorgica]MBF6317215.1 ABC transporter permease [Nocardia cyriacigeorgica]MBF6323323.1 ABC transporter permease [Nocardia cyriacigeorgica]MBF6532233.1 ABC transporter permease [Nocardia cyriacigeorgica]